MDTWFAMIKDVGFPTVVTFYLLYRIEGKLDELIQSVRNLPYIQATDQQRGEPIQRIEKQG
ncbi:YvrJ family protein [Sporolactobacillus sp. THM7-4]|nr:YvrJ family protein [Sporolactobacillus sp. THM7-4]